MRSVLHIIPASAMGNSHHGSYKDIISRVRWLEQNVETYRQVLLRDNESIRLDDIIQVSMPSHVLFEYTGSDRLLRNIRKSWPSVWMGVRSHNIEPMQHFDNLGWWPKRGPLWLLYGMGRLLVQDTAAKLHAHVVLTINEWENRVYWKRLPGRADVVWLPYLCPEHLRPESPLPYEKRRIIACLPPSRKYRKSLDLVMRFYEVAEKMRSAGCLWDFVVTGNLDAWDLPESPHVTRVGFVEHLGDFIGQCRAVAMLSPLGYGFKTTLMDALTGGCHAWCHPELLRRSPELVRPYLTPLDSSDADSISAAVKRLDQPPLGEELCRKASSLFDERMRSYFAQPVEHHS